MLDYRLQRWPSIKTTSGQPMVLTEILNGRCLPWLSTRVQIQQAQNICLTFIQRRPDVEDVGQTLYKCYANVLCLLGSSSDDDDDYDYVGLYVE